MALEMSRPRDISSAISAVEAISAEAKRTIYQNVLLPLIEHSTFDIIIEDREKREKFLIVFERNCESDRSFNLHYAIEKEWESDNGEKDVSFKGLDRLRERKHRLHANKARLEQERRQLQGQLKREGEKKHSNPENETRQEDNNREIKGGKTHDRQRERKDDGNRPRSRRQAEEDSGQARDRSKRGEARNGGLSRR
ncbi:hypothetical protein GCK32_011028 [Trichostrongylus colubriformis]|uniref:Uncharacterized protein n=1 Tax=Trichostrongylus colubriformis TaxID=6319 RepID=A0AAN8FPP4_TRICO